MVDTFVKGFLQSVDAHANANVKLTRVPLKSGANKWTIAGVQTVDWLALSEAVRSRFGARIEFVNDRPVLYQPKNALGWKLVETVALGLLVLCGLLWMLSSGSSVLGTDGLKSLVVAVVGSSIVKLVTPWARKQLKWV